jgi:plasmid maintenance system antidote protein VapI
MNMNKLKAKIIEQEMNVEQLAEIIGMTGPTLYRKMRAPLKITIGEAIQIKDVLGLTDEEALDIFLI